jgi:hypothetical protein
MTPRDGKRKIVAGREFVPGRSLRLQTPDPPQAAPEVDPLALPGGPPVLVAQAEIRVRSIIPLILADPGVREAMPFLEDRTQSH